MKLLLSWIKDYLDIPFSVEEISNALTLAGLEVEGITPFEEDFVFEIGLTPNLGHCFSVLGIARELSALFNLPLKKPSFSLKESKEKTASLISVEIQDKQQCEQYHCRVVKHLKIGPSPSFIKQRLEACGIRSINNIVDVSNYVMLAVGQPLHFFDYSKIEGTKLIIRASANDFSFVTLDGQTQNLKKGLLLICDAKKPLAIAGVMGGESSAVTASTTEVLIESAFFNPSSVRKSSKLTALRTEGSLRFERGVDPEGVTRALSMAAALLSEIASGELSEGSVSEQTKPFKKVHLDVRPKRVNELLGTRLSLSEMQTFLQRLEIKTLLEKENLLKIEIPSYRNDLHAEIDLVEEIGRLFGFNNIERKAPLHVSSSLAHAPLYLFEEKARENLVALGLQECLTCDLISPKMAALTAENALNTHSHIHVLSPSSIDQSVLRPSLLPGLLEVVKFNLDRQTSTLYAFEVGHIHFKEKEKYFEESAAALIMTGNEGPYLCLHVR